MSHVITLPLDLVDPAGTWSRLATRLTTMDPARCWDWTGATDPVGGGYGLVAVKCHTGGSRWGWRAAKPHRVAWTVLRGPIPEGMVLDHVTCRNRVCCNPDHMEVVTQAENARRVAAERMTACPKCGSEDLIVTAAQTRCRPCTNAYKREWQRRKAEREVTCAWCGGVFTTTPEHRIYCSAGCAARKTTLAYRRAHGVPAPRS